MGEPLFEVENLRTEFATDRGTVRAVNDVSFRLEAGESLGIVGESGSGKTVMTLSVLQLLDSNSSVTADAVRFKGEDLLGKAEHEFQEIRGNEISMIFQDPMSSLNPVMTVGEQIAEVARRHDDDSGESSGFWNEMKRKYVTGTPTDSPSWRRAVEMLETVGIPEPEARATDYPHQLSGGMKQRVMIAQAMVAEPSLIIADEPTTALDVTIEAQILEELKELQSEFEVSIIFVTHDLGVVREVCDRVAVMYAGEFMETAEVETLFENPLHPYTQGLLQSIPKMDDDREWLEAIEGSVPNLIGMDQGCPFRNRCSHAFELCDQPLVEYGTDAPDHGVRCHLYNDHVEFDGNRPSVDSEVDAKTELQNMAETDADKASLDQ